MKDGLQGYTPDLWKTAGYARLWLSLLAGGFGGQIAALTVSLAAAIVLHASAAQMGVLGAAGTLPYVLLMLPAGVWLDRTRKLPAYIAGEAAYMLAVLGIPLALATGTLRMESLYAIAFVSSCVSVISGTAGQVLLTCIVRRDQLVEAHARNRVAGSFAEIAGPGAAGLLIRIAGVGASAFAACALMLTSILALRGLRVAEEVGPARSSGFWKELAEGIRFVRQDRRLLSMALVVGSWQLFQTCAMVIQVLFATRELGMGPVAYGLSMTVAGIGTFAAAAQARHLARRIGPGIAMIAGIAISGCGWLQLAWAPSGFAGIVSFLLMLWCYGVGVTMIFSNMLALRQAVTPQHMLARMTSTMRWLTLFPAWPGTLLGGYLGERFGLRFPILAGGIGAVCLAVAVWRHAPLRTARIGE